MFCYFCFTKQLFSQRIEEGHSDYLLYARNKNLDLYLFNWEKADIENIHVLIKQIDWNSTMVFGRDIFRF